MPALEDYVYALEALEEASLCADALVAFACAASGTGVCGVTTSGEGVPLPLPEVAGAGDFWPAGGGVFPGLVADATTSGWHPAWGAPDLPVLSCLGQASFPLAVSLALSPLFGAARCGALAGLSWPAPGGEGAAGAWAEVELGTLLALAASGLNRSGAGGGLLPRLVARAFACGLESPGTSGASSRAVVGLLCQGDPELGEVVASLRGMAVGDDALAGALFQAVAAAIAYVADGSDGEDVWTCALGTYFRGTGDCEDGAILLHALLLAAGLPADRLVTAFGRVGVDRQGHAWVAYRRRGDGRWTALDWTFGTSQGPVSGLPVLGESGFYAVVDYALTASAFFTVRQVASVFFARSLADGVALPALALDAGGARGGRASLALAAGWLACQAGGAARGQCRLVRAGASGTAGAVRGTATVPALAGQGGRGAVAVVSPAGLGLSGRAGGGGQARARLLRPRCAAAGEAAALVAGMLSLAGARAVAVGWAGGIGGASCQLPRPGAVLGGQVGGLAPGGVALPLPGCLGQGGEPVVVAAWETLFALGARGLARPGGAMLQTDPLSLAQGGEWL